MIRNNFHNEDMLKILSWSFGEMGAHVFKLVPFLGLQLPTSLKSQDFDIYFFLSSWLKLLR